MIQNKMTEYPQDIWNLLKSITTYVPKDIVLKDAEDKKYQLFEVIFTKLISLVSPHAKWIVTPIQGDEGIDFYGEQKLFKFEDLGISASVKIGGQCKIRSSKESPIKSLSGDIIDMVDEISPIYVIVGFASKNDTQKLEDSQAKFTRQLRRPVYLFGLKEINCMMIKHFNEIKPIIKGSLEETQANQLIDYYNSMPNNIIPEINCNIIRNISGQTGIPSIIRLNIESILLNRTTIKAKWIRPDYDKNNNIIIIKPNAISSKDGIIYNTDNGFNLSLEFKFISYIVGKQSLGEIELTVDNEYKKIINLGEIDLHDNYHPRFYWKAHEKERNIFNAFFSKIQRGCIEVISVVGEGGAGKSRLINELGIYGEQQGAEYITISQYHNYEKPYQILADLLFELIEDRDYLCKDYFDAVYNKLQLYDDKLAKDAKETLRILFDKDSDNKETPNLFDKNYIINALLVLSLIRFEKNPLIIHFSDLHWCHHSVLSIFAEFINKLKKVQQSCKTPLLLIFEGRIKEVSEHNKFSLDHDYSTETFELFVKNNEHTILLEPFSREHSRGFLKNIFENSQSNLRRIKDTLIPHQALLIDNISRYGSGNPFHMLEQIKLLETMGIIRRNKDTGLLFLLREIPKDYEVPLDVESLIKNRYNFIKKNTPEISNLIRSLALIQDRVSYKLFKKLLYNYTGSYNIETLLKTDILLIPQNEYTEVKFRHENYYNVIKNIFFDRDGQENAVKCYLEWLNQEDSNSAEIFFFKALVLSKSIVPNHNEIVELLETSKEIANRQHNIILKQRILFHLLDHIECYSIASTQYEKLMKTSKIKQELAGLLIIGGGNWGMASVQFKTIVESINSQFEYYNEEDQIRKLNILKYSVITNLANSYINQLKTHESINILVNNIDYLRINYEIELGKCHELEWLGLYLSAINRLGVAFWHDGNYNKAIECFSDGLKYVAKGIESAPNDNNLRLLKHGCLLDMGAVNLHFNPKQALKDIDYSISLISDIDISPRYLLLGQITQIMGKIVYTINNNEELSINDFIKELEPLFFKSKNSRFTQEESASGLIIAILYALEDDERCVKWFMDVINICFQNNLLETLWKAHINLAQFEFHHNNGNKEASVLHAQYAEDMIKRDLGNRNLEEMEYRLKHFRLPIQKINEILNNSSLYEYYENEELFKTNNNFEENILFLENEECYYFLYGG